MQTTKDSIISTLNLYKKTRKQRNAEILKYPKLKSSFYKARKALENYFSMFLKYKGNDFETYYSQHKDDYNKALDAYSKVVDILKKTISENEKLDLSINNKTEALETKAHIESVKNGINDDIKDLILKPVEGTDNRFSYANLCSLIGDGFNVIIMNVNGYVSAKHILNAAIEYENNTRKKLAEANNKNLKLIENKSYKNFKQTDIYFQVTEALRDEVGIPTSSLEVDFREKNGVFDNLRGTYIHPDLVNTLVSWVSPTYALIINRLIRQLEIQKRTKHFNNLISEKEDSITILSKKIDELKHINLEQSENIKELLGYSREAKQTLQDIDYNVSDLSDKCIETTNISDNTYLVLMYNNTGNDNNTTEVKNTENITTGILYPFTFIRRQQRTINSAIKVHKSTYPNSIAVFEKHVANAVVSLKNIKKYLYKKIRFNYNDLYLKPNYSKEAFIKDIIKVTGADISEVKFIKNKTISYK